MRAFVTGLDGFAGQWLARELMTAGDEVAGGSRNARPSYTILSAEESGRLAWFPFELADEPALGEALRSWRPDAVYHLAAQASVSASFADPVAAFEANARGTSNVMDAVGASAPGATVLYVGSAEAYGAVAGSDLPIRETTPLRPNNPYAESKAQGEAIALACDREGGLRVSATRSFNHIGPGQRTTFAVASFASQIADIARARRPPVLEVGNLDARRDFTDVRDVVRAYRLIVQSGGHGRAYNVCSGTAVSMREIVDALIGIAGVEVEIRVDAGRLRPVDTPVIVGDHTRLREATGWAPMIALSTSLEDLFAWFGSA